MQSGNAVFRAKEGDAATLTKQLETAFEKKWGFYSRIMVRDLSWFERLVNENPYPEAAAEHTKLHAYVLEREPTADEVARLAEKCTGPERFEIKGDVLYLSAPDGLGCRADPAHAESPGHRAQLALRAGAAGDGCSDREVGSLCRRCWFPVEGQFFAESKRLM